MREAFVNTMRRDYIETAELWSAAHVITLLPGWFEDYHEHAPHSVLGVKLPPGIPARKDSVRTVLNEPLPFPHHRGADIQLPRQRGECDLPAQHTADLLLLEFRCEEPVSGRPACNSTHFFHSY